MTTGIYCIRNTDNGKYYVGQSVNIERRWMAHRARLNSGTWRGNLHLQKAWIKYGASAFSFAILEPCERAELANRELYWIAKLRAVDRGYNKQVFPLPNPERRLTAEHKRRISLALKGKPKTREHSTAAGKARRAKAGPITEETRQKMRAAMLGRVVTWGHKISDGKRGVPVAIERREKIAATLRGRPLSPESIAKRSATVRGRSLSIETRRLISERLRGHSISAETRKRISDTKRARKGAVA